MATTTLPAAFALSAARWPSRPALTIWSSTDDEVEERISFRDFLLRAAGVAAQPELQNVQAGTHVCMLSMPLATYFITAAGVLLRGGACVNGNYKLAADRLAAAVVSTPAALVLASATYLSLCDEAARTSEAFAKLPHAVLEEIVARAAPASAREAAALVAEAATSTSPHSAACVMFTSGSTGTPKAVPLTHEGLLWACRAKLATHVHPAAADDASADVFNPHAAGTLALLPAYHVMGFTNNWLFNIVCGWPTLVHAEADTRPLSIDLLTNACRTLQPAIVDTVPHLLEALADRARDGDLASVEPFLPSADKPLRLVLYGGCALSTTAYARLTALGVPLASQYGQTEVAGMAMIGKPGVADSSLRMRPVSGIRVELRRDDGSALKDSPSAAGATAPAGAAAPAADAEDTGQLVLLGMMSASPGYLGRPPPSPPSTEAHLTGDLFRRVVDTADGGWWYEHVCRKDDLIVHTTGEMTNPLPIEDALIGSLRHAGVSRLAVVGQRRPLTVLVLERTAAAAAVAAPSSSGTSGSSSSSSSSTGSVDKVPQKVLEAALAAANALAPTYSHVRSGRVITVPPNGLPVSNKGSLLRHVIEADHKEAMDAMDAKLLSGGGAAAAAAAAASTSAEGMDETDGGGGGAEPDDSLSRATFSGAARSANHHRFAHFLALCMWGIVLHHVSQFGQDVKGPGIWLVAASQLFAIPGFIFAAGHLDYTHPSKSFREVGRKLLVLVVILVVMMFIITPLLASSWLLQNLFVYRLIALPLPVLGTPPWAEWALAAFSVVMVLVYAITPLPWPLTVGHETMEAYGDLAPDPLCGNPYASPSDSVWPYLGSGQCYFTGKQVLLDWSLYYVLPRVMPSTCLSALPQKVYYTTSVQLPAWWPGGGGGGGKRRLVEIRAAFLIRLTAALLLLVCVIVACTTWRQLAPMHWEGGDTPGARIAGEVPLMYPELGGLSEVSCLAQASRDLGDDFLWMPSSIDAAGYVQSRFITIIVRMLVIVVAIGALCHLMPSSPGLLSGLGDTSLLCFVLHLLATGFASNGGLTVGVTCPFENAATYFLALGGGLGGLFYQLVDALVLGLAAFALQVGTSFYVSITTLGHIPVPASLRDACGGGASAVGQYIPAKLPLYCPIAFPPSLPAWLFAWVVLLAPTLLLSLASISDDLYGDPNAPKVWWKALITVPYDNSSSPALYRLSASCLADNPWACEIGPNGTSLADAAADLASLPDDVMGEIIAVVPALDDGTAATRAHGIIASRTVLALLFLTLLAAVLVAPRAPQLVQAWLNDDVTSSGSSTVGTSTSKGAPAASPGAATGKDVEKGAAPTENTRLL